MNIMEIFALFTASEQNKHSRTKNPLDKGFGWWVTMAGIALVVARLIW